MEHSTYYIETLKGLRRLLTHLNICKGYTTIGKWTFSNSIFFLLNSFSIIIYITSGIWLCYEYNFNLGQISGALCLCCGDTQILLISICLTMHQSLIGASMDALQTIVNKRKYWTRKSLLNTIICMKPMVNVFRLYRRLQSIYRSTEDLWQSGSVKCEAGQIFSSFFVFVRSFIICAVPTIAYLLLLLWVPRARYMATTSTSQVCEWTW